jgi:uncharacterized membrane protein
MNELVVLTFHDQVKIDEGIRALRKLHSERSAKLYASAVVAKGADGKFSVREITDKGHSGTRTAALIGALAGLLAGPAAATVMAVGGAAIGNAADLSAEDDFTEFATNIADQIDPGGAAIVADVSKDRVTAFKAAMQDLGGTVLHS